MDAVLLREYRRERSDGTLKRAADCLAIVKLRLRCWRSADYVDHMGEWSEWQEVEGEPGALRRFRVDYDDTPWDDEPTTFDEQYAVLRERGIARHLAARVAARRVEEWNREPDYVVAVVVEVTRAGRTGFDSLGGIGVESLSDPYLWECINDCTDNALSCATSAA